MKLLEIKNNLVKLSYSDGENPVLGRFIILASATMSYVAQFVNLKSDTTSSYAIAKLLFTFTPEGVVDNYDGSIPSIDSELSFLPSSELLNLLPLETPIKFGNISQQEDVLVLDISIFERNLSVFVEKDVHKTAFISNCVRQLFQQKEKCVIVDNYNLFEDYDKIVLSKDYKLPLNASMIDYIFEYDLTEVDVSTKAIIQDIFYEVQQYINSLEEQFLPIDKFVDVVAQQYKATQMPELALLKNKLLKYRDAGIFANTIEEIAAINDMLNKKSCVIFDLKEINDSLQKEVISYIHKTLDAIEKYIYFFVPLSDNNSDKKLLKQLINHNHVFSTLLVSPSYKYASELTQHAQNMLIFAPSSVSHSFSAYNTFLSKLNPNECIVEGKLTQGIPFVIDMDDLDLPLTKEDVLGERCQFVPVMESVKIVRYDDYGNKILVEEASADMYQDAPPLVAPPVQKAELSEETPVEQEEFEDEFTEPQVTQSNQDVIKPVANLLSAVTSGLEPEVEINPVEDEGGDDDLVTFDEINEEIHSHDEDLGFDDDLTEEDLNYIDENQIAGNDDLYDESDDGSFITEQEQEQVVPIYSAGDDSEDSAMGFSQGDSVTHPRYGRGVVEKIIKYGNKTLCSISFENVGRRLLDPSISELTKLC